MANTIEIELDDLLVRDPEDLCGEVVDGYRVEEQIGSGLMGDVYRCVHGARGEEVALKVLRASWSQNAEVVARFEREARAASSIAHPGVVRALGFGRLRDGRSYMFIELCRGESLRDVLVARGRLQLLEALHVARGIAVAVQAAHSAGVVHRDLKPENVMLVGAQPARSPDRSTIRLLDFGLARVLQRGAPKLTAQHMVMGTPKYMAPEQCGDAALADHRADLYSLGILLYEMLCGRPPFVGDMMALIRAHLGTVPAPPSRIAPEQHIPATVDRLVLRLLEKRPADRPVSATEVITTLDVVAGSVQLGSAMTGEFTALLSGFGEQEGLGGDTDPNAIPIDLADVEVIEPSSPGLRPSLAPAPGGPAAAAPEGDRARVLRLYVEQKAASVAGEDLFAVLDLPKTATEREVEAAYVHAVRLLDPRKLAEHGLQDLSALALGILERVREARQILRDPAARPAYERSIKVSDERDRAEAQARAVLQADLEYQHGMRLLEAGEFAHAEQVLSRAVDANPEPHYRAARAWARYSNVENPRAQVRDGVLLSLILALRERPQLVQAHCYAGQIYLDAGERERAKKAFARALKLDPTCAEALEGQRRAE